MNTSPTGDTADHAPRNAAKPAATLRLHHLVQHCIVAIDRDGQGNAQAERRALCGPVHWQVVNAIRASRWSASPGIPKPIQPLLLLCMRERFSCFATVSSSLSKTHPASFARRPAEVCDLPDRPPKLSCRYFPADTSVKTVPSPPFQLRAGMAQISTYPLSSSSMRTPNKVS